MSFWEATFLAFFMMCVSIVYPLTGSNVCTTVSLVPASMYSSSDLETNCEVLGLTSAACQAVRDGRINVSELYLTFFTDTCCDGWTQEGDMCSACPPGRYGRNCSLSCQCLNDGSCDHVTGECSCSEGWTGKHCEERCSTATFSSNCSLPCLSTCQNEGVCHPSNGHCLCDFGWEGESCGVACTGQRCYMESDSCSNGATYSPTGHCHCAPGWQGRYCTEPCASNKYGAFCDGDCKCQHGGLCNWEDGSCLCGPGYTGVHCESPCGHGLFGQDCALRCDCPMNARCDAVEGSCLSCPSGFTGPRCTDPCSTNLWGTSCHQECNCTDKSECDRYTGECPDLTTSEIPSTTSINHSRVTTNSDTTPTIMTIVPYAIPSDKGSPNASSYVIPVIVCVILVAIVSILIVVALKHPCRRKSSVQAHGVVRLTHQYADYNKGKEESEYAEIADINGDYEVPMLCDLDKPSSSCSTTSTSERRRQCEVNYYQTPPVRPPSSDGTTPIEHTKHAKVDNNGYLHLNESRSPPPEYQTIITRGKWNLK